MKYNRVLLKLSGESLMGSQSYGIDPAMLEQYAKDIKEAVDHGVEVAIVIGGGNIFRGLSGAAQGMDRVQGDYMGMLATLINSMALQAELEKQGLRTTLLSGLAIEPICQEMSRRRAIEAMQQEENRDLRIKKFFQKLDWALEISARQLDERFQFQKTALKKQFPLLMNGLWLGSGNPFFTTDTASALRAVEIQADAILKGTRVDGVYTADPEKDPTATKFETLTFGEALSRKLKIMDLTAFALCEENNLPIYVFDMNKPGNLLRVVSGQAIGTEVK